MGETASQPQPANAQVPVFWAALAVGLGLAVGGVICLTYPLINATIATLILCSGLGIVFGAFSSTATINYKGVVVTGVAAVAIALLWIVDYMSRDDYVMAWIDGDVRGSQITVQGQQEYTYLGAVNQDRFQFIVIGREIEMDELVVTISFPDEAETKDKVETKDEKSRSPDYLFGCVDKRELEPYLGSGRHVQWRFDRASEELLAKDDRVIATVGPCPSRRRPGARGFSMWDGHLLRRALAAEVVDVTRHIEDLRSASPTVRREARDTLASQGPAIVRPLADALRDDPDSYRIRLGVVVALAEMLRAHYGRRDEVVAQLQPPDLARLVAASGDSDRTIRVYASEFLYDLADPRVVDPVLEQLPAAGDNERYNLILVLQGVYPALDDQARQRVAATLRDLDPAPGPKTQELIASFVQL